MAEGEKLENPFAKEAGKEKDGGDGSFLAFSSSTPRGSPSGGGQRGFKAKFHNKTNRQDNWKRFGQFNQQQEQMNMTAPEEMMSPLRGGRGGGGFGGGGRSFRGSPYQNSPNFHSGRGNSPHFRGGFRGRGGGGDWRGHPGFRGQSPNPGVRGRGGGGDWGHSPNFRGGRGGGGGGHRGGGRGGFGGSESYFHPSMLEDPWARLERQRGGASFSSISDREGDGEKAAKQLSDSMIPQVGESFFERNLNPAPDVDASMTSMIEPNATGISEDARTGFEDGEEGDSIDAGADVSMGNGGGAGVELSDSMVPLVGDSVLQSVSSSANSSRQE